MPYRDIVVIGASTGGIEALQVIAGGLPAELKASIFVVLHSGPFSPNILHKILDRAGPLPTAVAENWERIQPGRIYVPPPDHHLLVEAPGLIRVSRGPKENRFRPAIDPLFRSAAHAFGPRVVGIVLTGFLDDGAAGLWSVKEQGGICIVQNPKEALAPSMPRNALKTVAVDHIVPLTEIAPLIVQLAQTAVEEKEGKGMSKEMEAEVKIARKDNALESGIMEWGEPSVYACPECHGVLLQLKEGGRLRFRCHTGHAYSVETLLKEFGDQSEETLWNAIRSMEESVLLMRRMARRLSEHGHNEEADELLEKARDEQERSNLVREVVMHRDNAPKSGERKRSDEAVPTNN